MPHRALVVGWFSFTDGEATAGDLDAAAMVRRWLTRAGVPHDVAYAPAFAADGVLSFGDVDPSRYSHLVFACGPAAGDQVRELTERFVDCRKIAIGVSDLDDDAAGRFDVVLPRDHHGPVWPDLAAAATDEHWPLVVRVLAHDQPEYGSRACHEKAHDALEQFLDGCAVAVVDGDTRVDPSDTRRRSVNQIHALFRAADVIVTSRLHGLVLGLRVGTPVLAVDPIAGGAKVRHQAAALGWPAVLTVDELSEPALHEVMQFCLSPDAADAVRQVQGHASVRLHQLERLFLHRAHLDGQALN